MKTTKCVWCNKDIEILVAGKPPKYCRDNWNCKANFTLYKHSLEELKFIKPIVYAHHYGLKIKCKNYDYCNNKFIPNRGRHMFCSDDCHRILSGRKPIAQKYCLHCGKEIAMNRKFCNNNNECKKKYSHHPLPERKLNCIQCNKEFTATHPQAKMCSQACKSRHNYLKNRDVNYPYKKVCTICGVKYTTKKHNQTICLSYECKQKRYNLKYKRYKTKNRNDYKEKDGYLYCVYHKEFNVYKVGITYKPSDRLRKLERCGFTFKLLYEFPTKHDARLAEREFYIDAESMSISPPKNDRENNKFFDPVFKSYSGKTEVIYGEMIKYYELKKMLDSLMGKEISQTHKRLTHPV